MARTNVLDDRLLEHRATRDRQVGGEDHVGVVRCLEQLRLREERVVFHLIGHQFGAVHVDRFVELDGGEVAHADAAGLARVAHLSERAQRVAHRHFGARPVDQQQVDVVHLQPLEALTYPLVHGRGRERVEPDLGGDEQLVARHAGFPDRLPHLGLVAVTDGGVDMAVAVFDGRPDRGDAFVAGQFECSKSKGGHGDAFGCAVDHV